jgi:hypothetical protein
VFARFLGVARRLAGHGYVGLLLVIAGEALILARHRPVSDYYFPVVWLGYILFLDAALFAHHGRSLLKHSRALAAAMIPMSIAFWWLFELFNVYVHNWTYLGAQLYSGLAYVAFASLDFSFVLLAVWTSALFVRGLLPRSAPRRRAYSPVPPWFCVTLLFLSVPCIVLPILFPRYAFGLIWGSMYFLLDPLNYWLGRPSVVQSVWNREWRLPLSFALGALMCGFFWEVWNYWSMPKWVYIIPYVDRWHIFEMPLLGWLGYLPFGLELFAMTNFVLPVFRLGSLALEVPADRELTPERVAS